MYIDDFEINNPLGSHASVHSISAIYYSFPLSDQSKLLNIHLAALIKAADVKDFGLFIGDNLGINAISEFSRSFSSNFFCRFCNAHKMATHKLCKENNSLLRITKNEDIEMKTNNTIDSIEQEDEMSKTKMVIGGWILQRKNVMFQYFYH
ncbi:hypothetical protein QTP88_008688 [Uroleucon formosanum]